MTEESLTVLDIGNRAINTGSFRYLSKPAHTSKASFQYGLRVFFTAAVVCVCPPSTVTTAKG